MTKEEVTLKMLQVEEDTHARVKEMARLRRMPIRWYVEYLVEMDEDLYDEEILNKTNRPLRDNK